ncbi:hypothetical protein Ciccas_008257 [Cichlidogyrus casuarinus]|uniref:Glyoxylate reductase/hydroxypyruvate reductase n=1 Tax=Cichlidogyrus casuarinus TaxID=1844966 RepID=A0ABD2Q0G9_9PLAT
MSVGYDHVDTAALKAAGVRLGYTPGVLADATAELAIALLLATSRKIVQSSKTVPSGEWKAWSPFWMCGKGILDSTVGIIGLGTIGKKIAERIAPFRPSRILYTGSGKNTCSVPLFTLGSKLYSAEYAHLDTLLSESDFVVVICVLNESTRHLINEDTLSKMKPGSILINVSRGDVVDQSALYNALSKSSKREGIAAAGLDVCTPEPLPIDSPLLQLPNCLIIPHLGSATVETRKFVSLSLITPLHSAMVDICIRNIIAGLRDQEMPHEVNL